MIFSEGLKNEFETAVVNEPSVFVPLKFYSTVFGISTVKNDEHTYIMIYTRWCLTTHFSPFIVLVIIAWFLVISVPHHDLYYKSVIFQRILKFQSGSNYGVDKK